MPESSLLVDPETGDDLNAEKGRTATEQRLWTWPESLAIDVTGWRRVELAVGDATLDFTHDEVVAVVQALLR